MRQVLAGIETEYGLAIAGRGPEHQISDSADLIRAYPCEKAFASWDYRFESPRSDLRGFQLERLSVDPDDQQFERPGTHSDDDVRTNRVLPNGARLYNDHGHPEYSTPECAACHDLALHDAAGELAVMRAARALSQATGRQVQLYKNNTDFHGASYGTHENYLALRSTGFERLYRAVVPMLVARQLLCGAGKVGSEAGPKVAFQLSQRADFLRETANCETLFRRPVFNTRDEPHADPERYIRLHVICGDANMMPACTRRKVGLIKLALLLEDIGEAPKWRLSNPAKAFSEVSRACEREARIELEGASWTTARHILESYLAAAERALGLPCSRINVADAEGQEMELGAIVAEANDLLALYGDCPETLSRHVDWAAKRQVLHQFADEGMATGEAALRAVDLQYHSLDPDEGLYQALEQMGAVDGGSPEHSELEDRLSTTDNGTRAVARSLAVRQLGSELAGVSWGAITLQHAGGTVLVNLEPERVYAQPKEQMDVGEFIEWVNG